MTIVLTGYMGSGKSSIGRELSMLLKCRFTDLDTAIEQREGCKVKDIFAERGEKEFRRIELDTLREVLESSGDGKLVLALGGGTIMQEQARELLRDTPKVYLRTRLETIQKRLGTHDKNRPMLQMHNMEQLYDSRIGVYESCADYIIDTDELTPAQIAGCIASLI